MPSPASASHRTAVLVLVAAWLRTLAAYFLVSLYILTVGPPGMVTAIVCRWPMALYWLGFQGIRLGLWLVGIQVVARGIEHVVPGRAAVYCVNHTSHLEPPAVFLHLRPLFPRLQIIYKKELQKTPVLGRVWDVAGFVPIDRRDRVQSDAAIEQAARQMRQGNSFLVFPEGTRSRTGELLPFKKGAFVLALRARAPVVPVAITGAASAMRRGSPVIRPVTMHLSFGEPIETAALRWEDRDALMHEARERIAAMLARGAS